MFYQACVRNALRTVFELTLQVLTCFGQFLLVLGKKVVARFSGYFKHAVELCILVKSEHVIYSYF